MIKPLYITFFNHLFFNRLSYLQKLMFAKYLKTFLAYFWTHENVFEIY